MAEPAPSNGLATAVTIAMSACAAAFAVLLLLPAASTAPAAPNDAGDLASARNALQVAISSGESLAAQVPDDADLRTAIDRCRPALEAELSAPIRDCERAVLDAIFQAQQGL